MLKYLKWICLAPTVALAISCSGMQVQPAKPMEHTLNVKVETSEKVNVKADLEKKDELPSRDIDSPYLGLSNISKINRNTKDGTCYSNLFSGISVSDYTRLYNDWTFLLDNTKVRKVQLMINSPGGDAFQGLSLADLINRFQARGLIIEAHAAGIVASAAVPVYAVCKPRYAAPGTLFMVHEAALWKWPGRETSSDIRAQNELMENLSDRYLGYLQRNSNLDRETLIQMEKKTTWFNAEQAKIFGLVDELE